MPTLDEIARARGFTVATIMTHIESLAEAGLLTATDLTRLIQNEETWPILKEAVLAAIEKHGPEKLKPLYEETKEQYDYLQIRLVRAWYVVEEKSPQ